MKRQFRNKIGYVFIAFFLLILGCSRYNGKPVSPEEAAVEWAKMTNYVTRYTPSNSPTFASRAFGYIGLCMYESVVHADPAYNSMAGQLNGLETLPEPQQGKEYSWALAMNTAQAAILENIYQQTSDENKLRIDSLEHALFEHFSDTLESEVIERSVAFGQEVADAIFEWSKTDGGHRGYLKNFDKSMQYPDHNGSWKPPLYAQSFSHYPLHPHWGDNRTFVKANRELFKPSIIPYDTLPGSAYYEEFMKVYEKERELTREQKEAAIWWGDDPDVTFTPPGHSYYIATIAVEQHNPGLVRTAETFAKTGLAVADAFIKCWEWKYHFFTERPNTFIPRYIDDEWESFWPDPPFPSFPSGHAIQAAAAATVLRDTYGDSFSFTDRAHEGRERDEVRDTDFVIRSFNSFWEAALETADSRFYGGIHTRQDNDVGIAKGKEIAKNILQLGWKKS
jgi:hypothetical protein